MHVIVTSFHALWGFSAQGQRGTYGRGRDNAQAKGECIIHPRPLLHCPSALTYPRIAQKLVDKVFSVTLPTQNSCWSF